MDDKPRFLVDVDDVLRNLVHNMVRIYNRDFKDNKKYEDVTIYYVNESFREIVEAGVDPINYFFRDNGHELFYKSEPIDGAVEAVNSLRDYGYVEIVTKQRSLENKIDTLRWLDENGVKYDSVSFVKHKSTVLCDYFIDDFHENFIDCGNGHNVGVLINAPYNQNINIDKLAKENNFASAIRCNTIKEFTEWYKTNVTR